MKAHQHDEDDEMESMVMNETDMCGAVTEIATIITASSGGGGMQVEAHSLENSTSVALDSSGSPRPICPEAPRLEHAAHHRNPFVRFSILGGVSPRTRHVSVVSTEIKQQTTSSGGDVNDFTPLTFTSSGPSGSCCLLQDDLDDL